MWRHQKMAAEHLPMPPRAGDSSQSFGEFPGGSGVREIFAHFSIRSLAAQASQVRIVDEASTAVIGRREIQHLIVPMARAAALVLTRFGNGSIDDTRR
jgi:hypothetical protein